VVVAGGIAAFWRPDLLPIWLALLLFVGLNLFQSGFTRFCLLEKGLKKLGLRAELDDIREMAMHDALTGLPNRLLLEERIEAAIEHARHTDTKVGMLFIDLDNFKQINDSQGHKTGDQLLVAVSRVLQAHLRPGDTLARWGGDEFVVLVPGLRKPAQARAIAEALTKQVQSELFSGLTDPYITLSIGVALFPDDADTCEALLIQADKALFFCKSQGRNNIQVFSDMCHRGVGYRDVDLTTRLAAAVRQHLIQVHYQPVIDARTGNPVAVEALARWQDPEHGWVSPALFVPMAENLGLIHDVGYQVLERALEDFSRCNFRDCLRLGVNISNRQLLSKTFVRGLCDLVARYEVDAGRLKLEVTESIALDAGGARECLRALSAAGFMISLDDFGTGFSSLSRLHELTVDEIKIDSAFVRRVKTRQGRVIVKTIVNLAQALDLGIVAEGVEDEETAAILREVGVQLLQGHYFGAPVPSDQCMQFMHRAFPVPRRAGLGQTFT
jgi:diguanylate cyclase (GGDEF)-like protein